MLKKSAIAISITERDLDILQMVFQLGGCSVDHVRTRFFTSTPGGRAACYARIAKLVEANYLASQRTMSAAGLGSGKRFLSLGANGRKMIAERMEVERDGLERPKLDPQSMFLAHHFRVCDFRIALQIAAASSQVIVDWTTERQLKRTPYKIKDTPSRDLKKSTDVITVIPDGLLTLELPDGRRHNFIFEQDMGTTHQAAWRRKIRGYILHLATGPTPPAVLIVCPNAMRLKALTGWIQAEVKAATADSTIFWSTTQGCIRPDLILSPIWRVTGWNQLISLTGQMASEAISLDHGGGGGT